MTQLDTDTLRRALRTRDGDAGPAADAAERLDVSAIISRGRGLRRRRRGIAIAGGACAAAAVFGLATGISQLVIQPAGSHQPVISPETGRNRTLPDGWAPTPRPSTRTGGLASPTPVPTVSPSAGTASPTATPSPSRSARLGPTPSTSVSPVNSTTGSATSSPTGSATGTHPTTTATSGPTAVPTGQPGGTAPTPTATTTAP
jgi:hypothetical protein